MRAPELIGDPGTITVDRPIPLNAQHREFVTRELKVLESMGLVYEDPTAPYSTTLFCVDKDPANPNPEKWFRMVFDYRKVNSLFPSVPTSLPPIPEVLQFAASAAFASAFDILAAFHQVYVHPDDRKFLAFTHPDGRRMTWSAWPFGFT